MPTGDISTVVPAIAITDAADAVLTGEKNRPTSDEADGLIFSRTAVTNSLLSKFGQGKQLNKVDAESLKRRLFSIAH